MLSASGTQNNRTGLTLSGLSTDTGSTALQLTGGTMSGTIDMANFKIVNLQSGATTLEVANAGQVAQKLSLSGGTMAVGNTGIIMNSGKISVMGAGTANNDATTVTQMRTGSLGRTAWLSGEHIKKHWEVSGAINFSMIANTIAVNGTTSLFGPSQFSYTPLVQASTLVLEFGIQIGAATGRSQFTTVIAHQGLTQTFQHNTDAPISTVGQQVIFKTVHFTPVSLAATPIVVTISATSAQSSGVLTVNTSNWTLSVQEYAT